MKIILIILHLRKEFIYILIIGLIKLKYLKTLHFLTKLIANALRLCCKNNLMSKQFQNRKGQHFKIKKINISKTISIFDQMLVSLRNPQQSIPLQLLILNSNPTTSNFECFHATK